MIAKEIKAYYLKQIIFRNLDEKTLKTLLVMKKNISNSELQQGMPISNYNNTNGSNPIYSNNLRNIIICESSLLIIQAQKKKVR